MWHSSSLKLKEFGKHDRKFSSEDEVRETSKQKMETSPKLTSLNLTGLVNL